MNILLITAEQQHHRTLDTPALDRLAAGGLAFDRAYCTSPTCEPSRATILTGWYPAWHPAVGVPTISALLSHLGYSTSLIGRAHIGPLGPSGETSAKALQDLDFWRRWTGPYRGFEHAELSWGDAGQHYALWREEKAQELPHEAWVAERTIAAIDAAVLGGRPFFCWASFDHGPITTLDHQLGRILDRLEALEAAGETLVVFTSDHGDAAGELVLSEALLRVPLVVRWPGRVPAGTRTGALHAHVDLAPTLLHALAITEPGPMQGESQLSVWLGERDRVRDHLIVEHPEARLRTYVDDRYKLTVHHGSDRGDLIDLAEDPDEHDNRFADPAYTEVKTALLHRFLNAELHREPGSTQGDP